MAEPARSAHPAAFISVPPRRVLFLCAHNSARSQMAEGFARALAPQGVEVWSAGSDPCGVNPRAVQVMEEVGIDIRSQTSKAVDDVPWRRADTVVTLCGESCDVIPAVAADVRKMHWPLADPGGAPEEMSLETFRVVRDEIRWRVASLWPRGD